MKLLLIINTILAILHNVQCVPFIVQTLSSRYAIVLGGYGPGYKEMREVEVVRHNQVCPDAIK